MLIPRQVFERIGLFDERFFAFSEDVDFCIRARAAGIPLYLHEGVIVRHAQSVSVRHNAGREFRDYHVLRNTLLLLRKHYAGPDRILRMIVATLTEYVVPTLFFLTIRRTPRRAAALSRALRDGWNGRTGKGWPDMSES
jgi:GT2 family glycosyltransferase